MAPASAPTTARAAARPSWPTASPAPPPTSAPPARAAASTATPTPTATASRQPPASAAPRLPPGTSRMRATVRDADMNVRPGQTNWFTSGSAACGGTFDYNCANGPELQYGSGIGPAHQHRRVPGRRPHLLPDHDGLVEHRPRLWRPGMLHHRLQHRGKRMHAQLRRSWLVRPGLRGRHHRSPDEGLPLIPGLASVDPKSAARRPRLELRELVWRSSDARIRVRVLALPGAEIGQVARRAGGLGRRGLRRGRRYSFHAVPGGALRR